MKFITSFNPHKRIDRQRYCLENWQQYDLPVLAVQHINEQEVERVFPGISYVYTCDYNYFFHTYNPSLTSMLEQTPGILINSDIHLKWSKQELQDYIAAAPAMGIRTEDDKLNPWGIDVFVLPEIQLPPNPFVIGKPGWDYWLAIELVKAHMTTVIKDGIIHAAHEERWNRDALIVAQSLIQAIYRVPSPQITRYIQQMTDRCRT